MQRLIRIMINKNDSLHTEDALIAGANNLGLSFLVELMGDYSFSVNEAIEINSILMDIQLNKGE